MHWIISGSCLGKMKVIITYYGMQLILRLFYPQAGLALPFPFDEKEAKILSKRTLSRAF